MASIHDESTKAWVYFDFGEFHILLGELHKFYHKPLEKSFTDVETVHNRCLALGLYSRNLVVQGGATIGEVARGGRGQFPP